MVAGRVKMIAMCPITLTIDKKGKRSSANHVRRA